MYVRFIIHGLDEDSGRRQGLFQAVSNLEHEGALLPYEQALYDDVYQWFRHNLKKPTSFSKSSKRGAKAAAISWFKDTAKDHIQKMREMAFILEAHGTTTVMIQTEKPGYIVYEDEFQVAAEPYADTVT